MKYQLDEKQLEKFGLSLSRALLIMLIASLDENEELFEFINKCNDKGVIKIDPISNKVWNMPIWKEKLDRILLDSDDEVPKNESLNVLVQRVMAVYFKGKKPGTPYYFPCNEKDNKLRFQKFFKLYGKKYTEDEIVDATKRYVRSHTPETARLLKYFIWKDEKKLDAEGKYYVDEHSDLADYLSNTADDDFDTDWTSNINDI